MTGTQVNKSDLNLAAFCAHCAHEGLPGSAYPCCRCFSPLGCMQAEPTPQGSPFHVGPIHRPVVKEMPLYACKKLVRALKIVAAAQAPGGWTLAFDGYPSILVPVSFMTQHSPVTGGYYVVYEDGYTSFCPARTFESGYTRVSPVQL